MYTQLDLTGENPLFRVTGAVHGIYKTGQTIELEQPAYKDTIIVRELVNGNYIDLDPNTDWTIRDDNVDEDAISAAITQDINFDKELVKAITILKPPSSRYMISIAYQSLTANLLLHAETDHADQDITVDLIYEMIRNINFVRNSRDPVSQVSSEGSGAIVVLEEDPSASKDANHIIDELHEIDVPNGVMVLRPKQGAFHTKDFVVERQSTPNSWDDPIQLNENVDYVFVEMNTALTCAATVAGGVFEAIVIKGAITGTLRVSYRAYGGEPTIQDIVSIKKELLNVVGFLSSANILTPGNLAETDVVNNLMLSNQDIKRQMGDIMRALAVNGTPTHADRTSGMAMKHRFNSPNSNLNWYTIASLYKVAGADDVFNADRMHFRVRMVESDMMFDIFIGLNLMTADSMSCNVVHDASGPAQKIIPEFRVIWNNTSPASGAYLQIGLKMPEVNIETFVIEDLSGNQCCWLLYPASAMAVSPVNDNIELPGLQIWSAANASVCKIAKAYFNREEGHIAKVIDAPIGDLYEVTAVTPEITIPYGAVKEIHFDATVTAPESAAGNVTYVVPIMTDPAAAKNRGNIIVGDSDTELFSIEAGFTKIDGKLFYRFFVPSHVFVPADGETAVTSTITINRARIVMK